MRATVRLMSAGNRIHRSLAAAISTLVILVSVAACSPPAPPVPPPPPPPDPTSTPTAEAAAGWAIHFEDVRPNVTGHYDAVSCASPYGPWHVVVTTSLTTTAFTVFYDFTVDPTTGIGPLTGTEQTAWPDGLATNGTYTGTATIAVTDDPGASRSLTLAVDESIMIHDPHPVRSAEADYLQKRHVDHELLVIPATDEEC